jgi:hypothetical protein
MMLFSTRMWKHLLSAPAAALGLLLSAAVCCGQSAPPNLPSQTVYGRLGIVGQPPGPGQAIPFATLTNNLFATGFNNQTTLLPSALDANKAYTAFFNPCVNATTYPCTGGSALPSNGVIFNMNRVKVGEASLASADYLLAGLPSTPSWLDTLFNRAIVGTSQLASGTALGTTGITGYARTSDFFNYAGSASAGSQGGLFIAYNDDTFGHSPIADAILGIGVQHSGCYSTGSNGCTTLGQQLDINAATTADVTPNANANGETLGLLITSGAYAGLAAAKPSAAIDIAYGGYHTFRRGINVLATALDPTVGCGGSCSIFADLPGGGNSGHAATIRWLDSTPGVDSEIWGDGNGFNVNSISRFVGQITGIDNALGGSQPTNAGDGLLLENTTAAANGAQQSSPNVHLSGQGWKTASTAASQNTDWFINVAPIQGSTAPTSLLQFSSLIGSGSVTTQATLSSSGVFTVAGVSAPASTNLALNAPTGQDIQFQVNGSAITVQQAAVFEPTVDNAIALGGTSNRWSTAYAVQFIGNLAAFYYNNTTEMGRITAFNGNMGFDTNAGLTHSMALYTSGGVVIGTTPPGDPSANNLAVQGTVKATGGFIANTSTGLTQTCTVNQAKTLVFTLGILTGGSCNS